MRLTSAAALLASYPLLFAAAFVPDGTAGRLPGVWLFTIVALGSYLAELWARRAVPSLVSTLSADLGTLLPTLLPSLIP